MHALGLITVIVAAVGALWTMLGARTAGWRTVVAILTGWWAGLMWLGSRFVATDLSVDLVDRYSRADAPWWLRAAATWASPNGSFVFWVALCLTAAAVVSRGHLTALRITAGVSLAATIVVATTAPFAARSDGRSIVGAGLNPVLEHPLMSIHPPVLYGAHALVIAAAVAAVLADDRRGRARARSLAASALGALIAATLMGAWWAHDELGWGGWWAWDPVENTALAPLGCLLASLHLRRRADRGATAWSVAALVAVLVGVAAARSGLAESVHAFAPNAGPALFVGLLAVATTAVLVKVARAEREQQMAPPSGRVPVESVLVPIAGAWIAAVVVAAELVAAWLGTRTPAASLHGPTVGTAMIPAGLALVVGVMSWGFRRRIGWAGMVAHVGAVLFAIGVVASLGDTSVRAAIDVDGHAEVDRYKVAVGRPRASAPAQAQRSVTVPIRIDGVLYEPVVVQYLDLDTTRARPARRSDVFGETEVVVSYVDDVRVSVEIRRHPGLGAVWLGGALAVIGTAGASRTARRRSGEVNPSAVASSTLGVEE